ncbi:MAG: transposase, partial [Ruminobacter sp.]|nr:transposase [Ruminobacter sp.]
EGQLSSNELAVTKRLKSWVNNTPIYLQLQWFDTVESVKISTKLRTYRWSTEVTACDSLYLKKIGVRND